MIFDHVFSNFSKCGAYKSQLGKLKTVFESLSPAALEIIRREDVSKGKNSQMKIAYFCDSGFSQLVHEDQVTFCQALAKPPPGFKISTSKR
jgi:hypothetical protein